MAYVEAHGSSLKELREKKHAREIHHLRIHAHPDGTPENPAWVVSHHYEDGAKPEDYAFDDGDEMLSHIAEHASVPRGED